jgi:hypothetical protein
MTESGDYLHFFFLTLDGLPLHNFLQLFLLTLPVSKTFIDSCCEVIFNDN